MNAWSASARTCVCRGLLIFSLSGAVLSAHALVLAPGDSGTPVPKIDLNDDFQILHVQRIHFGDLIGDSGLVTGEIIDRVLRLPDDRLAFETRVLVDHAPPDGVFKVSRTLFAGFPFVQVGYEDVDASNIFKPSSVSRSGGTGSQVDFLFETDANQGTTPIGARPPNMDADEWTSNPLLIITGPTPIDLIGEFQAYGPDGSPRSLPKLVWSPSPVPEPRLGVLLALGFAIMIFSRRPRVPGQAQ